MSLTITTTTSSLPIGKGQSVTIYLHDAQPGFTGTRHAELFIEVTPSGEFHVAKSPTLHVENMESSRLEDEICVITRLLDADTLPNGTAYIYDLGSDTALIYEQPRYRVDVAGVAVFAWMEDLNKAKAYARFLRDSRREILPDRESEPIPVFTVLTACAALRKGTIFIMDNGENYVPLDDTQEFRYVVRIAHEGMYQSYKTLLQAQTAAQILREQRRHNAEGENTYA